jgi:signal transduction histidine kinase/DNA-binding NarL/FixJ family response regulator
MLPGASATVGLRAVRRYLFWLHRFSRPPLVFTAIASVAGVVGIAGMVALSSDRVWLVAPIGVAFFAVAATAAGWIGGVAEQLLGVLGQAFDTALVAQLVATSDGRAVQANLAFERLLPGAGEAALDLIGQAAAPASRGALRSLREQAAAGAPGFAAVPLQCSDGGPPRRFEISADPGAGGPRYCLWTFREVSAACAQKPTAPESGAGSGDRLDRAASGFSSTPGQTHEQLGRFFANAPVGIAVVDRSGRFIKANRALGELFGTPPDTLIGRGLIGCLSVPDRARIAAKLADAANGREDRTPVEIRLEPPREQTMVMLLNRFDQSEEAIATFEGASEGRAAAPAVNSGSDPEDDPAAGLALYFIDVTEQKHLETQFAQSQKMQAVGQLAGGVAHDFNNLLTAMIGFCDLLLLRSRPGDPAFADIMQIKQNANRAANLVRQLLAFSRQQSLQPRVLDVTDVLVEVSHLLRRLIGENIELEFAHGRDLGLVKVDQGQLEQVVINLAVNARDAMPGGGRLTIRSENSRQLSPVRRGHEVIPAGDYVLIEVADTGIGIAPDNLARIFEPFFSTKSVGSGTGLGLSTVYGIVKQTGGFVFVDSAPGSGTTFAIYLPRHQPGGGVTRAQSDAAEPGFPRDLTGTGTIMLVEDDDAVRMFGARALRNKGYRVTEARNGEDALDLIRSASGPLDLLITDVVMPQMDGPSLIREVREVDPGIKVIFISGYAEDAFRRRLDSERDIHFLSKPFSLKQLAVKVKDVISGDLAGPQFSDCVHEQKEYSSGSAARCAPAPAVK